ncbi:MAG TPA: sporulation protein YqfC [Spirochaetia bacterium]|nr:sporulation protein YqfC [Spirochaetia bacterium]
MSWRDIRQKIMEQLSDTLEIPGDILPDLPRVILIGDTRLLVENHRGIGVYQADSVRISTSCGDLLVRGRDLVVKNILPEEITVEGQIRELSFLS